MSLSTNPNIKSTTKAKPATKRLPAKVISGKLVVIPLQIATPSPPAPINDAIAQSAIVITTIVLNPAKITGRARGI